MKTSKLFSSIKSVPKWLKILLLTTLMVFLPAILIIITSTKEKSKCKNNSDYHGGVCSCSSHFTGEHCEICDWKCLRGELIDSSCSCNCPGNWEGDRCQDCNLVCYNGVKDVDDCKCVCAQNFEGKNCEICNLDCGVNGRPDALCQKCICNEGWGGETCRECNLVCYNGTKDPNDCSCLCHENYGGKACNVCILNDCGENGIPNKTKCQCDCNPRYTGDRCDHCNLLCANGGSLDHGTCTCKCVDKWAGIQCTMCNRDCLNGSVRDEEKCTCECVGGFQGNSCELCSLNCGLHGHPNKTCEHCECNGNWGGADCNVCELKCENQGKATTDCSTCLCSEFFTGPHCETLIVRSTIPVLQNSFVTKEDAVITIQPTLAKWSSKDDFIDTWFYVSQAGSLIINATCILEINATSIFDFGVLIKSHDAHSELNFKDVVFAKTQASDLYYVGTVNVPGPSFVRIRVKGVSTTQNLQLSGFGNLLNYMLGGTASIYATPTSGNEASLKGRIPMLAYAFPGILMTQVYNEMTVLNGTPQPDAFYAAITYDNGYIGLQSLNKLKSVVFKLTHCNDLNCSLVKAGDKVTFKNFTLDFEYNWLPDTAYAFVIAANLVNNGTEYTAWFGSPTTNYWKFLGKLLKFGNYEAMSTLGSFIEPLSGPQSSLSKKAEFSETWTTLDGKNWKEAVEAVYNPCCVDSMSRIDVSGGVNPANSKFYLSSGWEGLKPGDERLLQEELKHNSSIKLTASTLQQLMTKLKNLTV